MVRARNSERNTRDDFMAGVTLAKARRRGKLYCVIPDCYTPPGADYSPLSSLSLLVKVQVRVMLRMSTSLAISGGNGE